MDRLTGEDTSAKENSMPFADSDRENAEATLQKTSSIRATLSSAMPPSRNSPLSWQRRPNSQASDRPRSRPLSHIATENAARSPRATPEPSSASDEQSSVSRDQISQMLGSKDPAWFRQTADRGENSPAYRKNQVEDNNVVEVVSSPRMPLPGMSREPAKVSEKANSQFGHTERSVSSSNASSTSGTIENGTFSRTLGSPIPLTNAQRLDPPTNSKSDDDTSVSGRALAMSPSQGRISPERGDRPVSPTKGMGGFVQSAMMKRSDSVNKRWSVQSPPGLSRGNSIASNRSSADPAAILNYGGTVSREPRPSSLSRDNSPLPLSRPTSSNSNATIVQDSERPGTSSSMRSSMTTSTTNDIFIKPSLPASRSQTSIKDGELESAKPVQVERTPPSSPSKLSDNRRWSPTKASWLESALNKPESPKPKIAPAPPQQPAWMAEINKAKQRNNGDSVDLTRAPAAHKHQVSIGGLMRSPPPGGFVKPPVMGGFPAALSAGAKAKKDSLTSDSQESLTKPNPDALSVERMSQSSMEEPGRARSVTLTNVAPKSSVLSPASGKVKPETPPKKDFRANLKPRQAPSDNDQNQEPEFKNVFGQLRRIKTQNYVAPDELKDNITRGKAGLNMTGGPKKTERKDEFKEAILKKKDEFQKAQLEGSGITRSTSSIQKAPAPLPEALAKKAALGRSGTTAARKDEPVLSPSDLPSGSQKSSDPPLPTLHKETSAPGRLQGKANVGGKLADRFNPALAGLLARGPPPASDSSPTSSPNTSQRNVSVSTTSTVADSQESGPQLSHMTKARARGPRRKAPSNLSATTQALQEPQVTSPKESEKPSTQPRIIKSSEEKPKSEAVKRNTVTAPVKIDEPENQSSEPDSPRKLDIKRRSRFLEEVSNKNEKAQPQLDFKKPLSPTKKAHVMESLVSKEGPGSPSPERKVAPSSKPKPISLSSMAAVSEQAAIPTKATPKSPEIAKSPPPVISANPLSPIDNKKRPSQVQNAVDTDSLASVRKSSAQFNRQTAAEKSRDSSTAVKKPIKLPTRQDEEAAETGAGLRSANQDRAKTINMAGLSFSQLKSSPVLDEKNNSNDMIDPAQKSTVPAASVKTSTRPLPTAPSKQPMSPPSTSTSKPSSPIKVTNQAVPQSSEASKLLIEFFGKSENVPELHVDTAAILSARPTNVAKIKTLRSQLFQLNGDGKKQQVPNHQERMLFENNMYLCTHTFGSDAGKKVVEVYFWAGDGVSESDVEDADIFAQREARAAGGQLVKLRQGKETSEFIEALGGIMITRRGSSNKYDSLAAHILCGRRYAGQIVFDEVDFSPASLCSGFPYLISMQSGKSYLWKGKGSGVDELSCARLIGMDFGVTGEIEEVEDGNEPAIFLSIFGNEAKIMKSADHWRLKPNYQNYSARLFCASPTSQSQVRQNLLTLIKKPSWLTPTAQITEIHPFNQASLLPSQIYILDAFFEIYIIVGSESQSQYSAFCTALLFAQEYGILAASLEDRPFVPVSSVVLEGVPRDLKFVFRKWVHGASPTVVRTPATLLSRGRSLRVVPLSAALDATRF